MYTIIFRSAQIGLIIYEKVFLNRYIEQYTNREGFMIVNVGFVVY